MSERRPYGPRVTLAGVVVVTVALIAFAAPPALAHGEGPETIPAEGSAPGGPMEPGQPGMEPRPSERAAVTELRLRAVGEPGLGETVRLEAVLVDAEGMPVEGAPIAFFQDASYAGVSRPAWLGTAWTDHDGVAAIATELRSSGPLSFSARFEGDAAHRPAETAVELEVTGSAQLYRPDVGLRVPGLGAWWLLVIVGFVWGLYLLVARQVVGIARAGRAPDQVGEAGMPRRGFLRAFLVPAGLAAGVASLGSGLLTILARSPRTHGNVGQPWGTAARHRLTPVAFVGEREAPALPPILSREVSFREEVLPILLEKGGPHTHPPMNSPPPHGVRLDSYEALMMGAEEDAHAEEDVHAEEDAHGAETSDEEPHGHQLVVPGKPEESLLVTMLVDPAHRMPPGVPLSREEIQIIASWVAQGAKDN